jgi:hypothetical protein
VEQRYDCSLMLDGYRIRVTVLTADKAKVEEIARQKASERLKQIYGINKAPVEFVVVEVTERILH